MKRKGFPGYGFHIEYHTVDPKKDKPANCIYLDRKRVCHCKDSNVYLEKCFIASYCRYRKKAIIKKENVQNFGNEFSNRRFIPLSEILDIKKAFEDVDKNELQREKVYFEKYGCFISDVVVYYCNNKYYVDSGHACYYVAKQMGINGINCKIEKIGRKIGDLFVRGAKVYHKTFGEGIVADIDVVKHSAKIKFDSGREVLLDFEMCIITGLMKLV